MTSELESVQLATTPELRVIEAARLYVAARQSFIRMRASRRYGSREIFAARRRRDRAADLLAAAVEELGT